MTVYCFTDHRKDNCSTIRIRREKKKDQLGVGWFEIIYKHMVLKSFNQKQGNKDTRIQELAECYIICGNTTAIDRGQ